MINVRFTVSHPLLQGWDAELLGYELYCKDIGPRGVEARLYPNDVFLPIT